MRKLPALSGGDVIRALEAAGFEFVRQHGSHVTMINRVTRRTVPVPVHGSEPLKAGTLLGIIREAGLTKDGFMELLG